MLFVTNSAERMRITSAGDVGIGTSSPAYKLDVSGSATNVAKFQNGSNQPVFVASASGLSGIMAESNNQNGWLINSASNFVVAYTNGAEKLRVDTSGNVGIGTSSPTSGFKLDVIGDMRVSDVAGDDGVEMGWSAGGSKGFVQAYDRNASAFRTLNLNNALDIDSSGNLGLGVTPSAWGSSYKAFDIGGGASIAGLSNNTYITANAYDNGSNYIYKATAAATLYLSTAGQHRWYNAPSGTAGNTISFTQAMTLDASGNWVIGSTNTDPFSRSDQRLAAIVGGGSGDNTALSISAGASSTRGAQIYMGQSSTRHFSLSANSSESTFGTTSNTPLRFTTNDTERARITSGGSLLVGTTTFPSGVSAGQVFKSTVADWSVTVWNSNATPYGTRIQYDTDSNGTGNEFLLCLGGATTRATIRSNGGLANYQANNVDLSDARTKKEINPAASMWNKIGALEIVTYKYNDQTHDDVNVGVIAQQVESVEPVWVDSDGLGETPEGEEPLKTVYTKDIYFAAIKALQEAMARIEQLETKVAALESK
jgi:hypothetical protein